MGVPLGHGAVEPHDARADQGANRIAKLQKRAVRHMALLHQSFERRVNHRVRQALLRLSKLRRSHIDQRDLPVGVNHHDGIGRRLDQPPRLVFRALQGSFGPATFLHFRAETRIPGPEDAPRTNYEAKYREEGRAIYEVRFWRE